MNIKRSHRLINIVGAIFFICLFLNDQTIYSNYFEGAGDYFLLVAVACILFLIVKVRKITWSSRYILTLMLWFISVLFPCIIGGFTRFAFVKFCYWLTLIVFLLILSARKIDYRESLFLACKIFCIWSLMCYVYTVFNMDFLPVTNISDQKAYNWFDVKLYLYFISKPLSHFTLGTFSLLRLDKPFGEPGIAQMYFNFALVWLLFFETKGKRRKIWIVLFSIGVFLSLSLIGYVIYFSILMAYCLSKKNRFAILMVTIFFLCVLVLMIIQKVGTFSYEDRTADYVFMFETIFDNLPFGIGLGNTSKLEHWVVESTGTISTGFYCGLLYPFAQYGVLGLVYYYMFGIAIKNFSQNKWARIGFGCFIVLTLLTEPQADEPFIVCFLFAGLLKRCIRRRNITVYEKNTNIHDGFLRVQ